MKRREFIGGAFALAGAAAWARTAKGGPDLKVGILSDIHLSPPDMYRSQSAIDCFVKVLEFFGKENADAVLIAGDLTNAGTMRELREVSGAWSRVFGGIDKGPVKIFVTGNHEKCPMPKAKREGGQSGPASPDAFCLDPRKNWKELFGEEWSPFFLKTVKGYSFVGAHWAEWRKEKALRRFLKDNEDRLCGDKPFFYTQHAHPTDTCYGNWIWHAKDGNPTQKVLAGYPNAVSFSGHTHYTITDERTVWQGSFTSIGTGALRWVSLPDGRENGPLKKTKWRRMGNIAWGSQGMMMSVWDDRMVFERYDFVNGGKVGDDWVVPVLKDKTGPREFSFENRRKKAVAPEFPAGAAVSFRETSGKGPDGRDERRLELAFPAARGKDSLSRPFDYEVAVEGAVCGDTGRPLVKLVYQPGVQWGPARDAKTVTCVFGLGELPAGKNRFAVTPLNSLGQRGRTVCASYEAAK